MRLSQCFIFFLLLLSGCEKYYLSVNREFIDQSMLASAYVGSPDPRKKDPPKGERLIIGWRLPRENLEQGTTLVLELLYKDYTQKTLSYPISKRRGTIIYSLLGKEHQKKKGLLTYKGEIRGGEGTVLKEWKQQLWTDLIVIDD